MIKQHSDLWTYLSEPEKILAGDGESLLRESLFHKAQEPTDYSYLVFPFAKLYEGFLKDIFLDLSIITERDYKSNHFRIGKVLSPNLKRRLGKRSAYGSIEQKYGEALASQLWHAWKEGRNLVFHYFPHNYRLLTREQAETTIHLLIHAMEEAVRRTGVRRKEERT